MLEVPARGWRTWEGRRRVVLCASERQSIRVLRYRRQACGPSGRPERSSSGRSMGAVSADGGLDLNQAPSPGQHCTLSTEEVPTFFALGGGHGCCPPVISVVVDRRENDPKRSTMFRSSQRIRSQFVHILARSCGKLRHRVQTQRTTRNLCIYERTTGAIAPE